MSKKIMLLGLGSILCLGLLAGCGKNQDKDTVAEEEPVITEAVAEATVTPTVTAEEPETLLSKDELVEISTDYAEQMAKLEFSEVEKRFSDTVKAQITADYLKSAWEQTVKPLGAYVGIYSQDSKEEEESLTVNTVLQYEKNGLLLRLVYDKEQKISGLWLNYQSLEEETTSELYSEQDIQIGKGDYVLDGKLTLPANVEKPPVVILVQGSGQSDMDETIGAQSNKPFRDIAQGLAEHGIASIRYNKRFYQYADKATQTMTINDEVLSDVSYAIQFALDHEQLDSERVFIIGHSLGGMLAPKIATDNEAVVGIVSLAGSPRKLEDIILDQAKDALEAQTTLSQEDKTYAIQQYEEAVAQVKNLGSDNLEEAILGVAGYYWKSLNEIDTPALVKQLDIPMLFLQGSDDFQVYPEIDFMEWKTILKGKENVEFKIYEGLNHLFMTSNGLRDVTEYDIKSSVDANVIDDIAEWILSIK